MESNIDSCKKRPLSITSTTSSTSSSLPRHQKKKLAPCDLSMTSYIKNISSEIVRTEETFANDLKQIIDVGNLLQINFILFLDNLYLHLKFASFFLLIRPTLFPFVLHRIYQVN